MDSIASPTFWSPRDYCSSGNTLPNPSPNPFCFVDRNQLCMSSGGFVPVSGSAAAPAGSVSLSGGSTSGLGSAAGWVRLGLPPLQFLIFPSIRIKSYQRIAKNISSRDSNAPRLIWAVGPYSSPLAPLPVGVRAVAVVVVAATILPAVIVP